MSQHTHNLLSNGTALAAVTVFWFCWDSNHLDSFSSGGQFSQQIQTNNYTTTTVQLIEWKHQHQLRVSIRQYTNCKHARTRYIRSGGNTQTRISVSHIDKQIISTSHFQGGSNIPVGSHSELVIRVGHCTIHSNTPHTPIHRSGDHTLEIRSTISCHKGYILISYHKSLYTHPQRSECMYTNDNVHILIQPVVFIPLTIIEKYTVTFGLQPTCDYTSLWFSVLIYKSRTAYLNSRFTAAHGARHTSSSLSLRSKITKTLFLLPELGFISLHLRFYNLQLLTNSKFRLRGSVEGDS